MNFSRLINRALTDAKIFTQAWMKLKGVKPEQPVSIAEPAPAMISKPPDSGDPLRRAAWNSFGWSDEPTDPGL